MIKKTTILSAIVVLLLTAGSAQTVRDSALLRNDREIDALIKQMTLEEKVEMLHAKHMFVSAGVERLGIADMKYTDGPFGIREELQPNSWTPLGLENDKATFFPTGSALAATWSPEPRMNMAPQWRVKPGCGERICSLARPSISNGFQQADAPMNI
jgi:beta-glucosidase